MDIDSLLYFAFRYDAPSVRNQSYFYPVAVGESHIFNNYFDITVPCSSSFELPVFMLGALKVFKEDTSAGSIRLISPVYKSGTDPYIGKTPYTVFRNVFKDYAGRRVGRLLKLNMFEPDNIFYATAGAVFDKDLHPLFLCSCICDIVPEYDNLCSIVRKKRIMHFAPELFDKKYGKVGSFFTNRVFKAAIAGRALNGFRDSRISIVIDNMPWKLHHPSMPSVSVSDDKLIQCVSDNYDKLFL